MKVLIKGFITCKSAEQYVDCADNYAVNKSSHRFSVSDGVSKSFFPKIYLFSKIIFSRSLKYYKLKPTGSQPHWINRSCVVSVRQPFKILIIHRMNACIMTPPAQKDWYSW